MTRRLPEAACAAILLLAAGCFGASADDGVRGKWSDNAVRNLRIGDLDIGNDRIRVGRTTYRVKPAGPFGSGAIFDVIGVDQKHDPLGCGPDGKVRFIAAAPLPPVEGTQQKAIRLYFYAGDAPPKPETIDKDFALCEAHPFGRN
jgi:hypothetical protein